MYSRDLSGIKYFSMYFSALDADEHTEIPADTVKWLANIACEYFLVETSV